MAYDLESIQTGRVERPPRIVLVGGTKVGKSTLACDFPSPIVIPVAGEEGVDDIDCAKFPTVHSFADLGSALQTLATEDHQYETLVIDSVTRLESLIFAFTCEQHGKESIEKFGYGKGYIFALDNWSLFLRQLDGLRTRGMTIVLIGHVQAKGFNDPSEESYDRWEIRLNKHAEGLLREWTDVSLYLGLRTFVQHDDEGLRERKRAIGGERILFTQPHPTRPSGGRGVWGRLPAEIPLPFPNPYHHLKQVVDAARAQENQTANA